MMLFSSDMCLPDDRFHMPLLAATRHIQWSGLLLFDPPFLRLEKASSRNRLWSDVINDY
jgi:hypothetical protein